MAGRGNSQGDKMEGQGQRTTLLPGRVPQVSGATRGGIGRLPSIRSRDLTLGGVKKKTFCPNIPVRKIKQEHKGEFVSPKREQSRERGGRRGDRGGRGGRGGGPEVIQSHSIFEQGPGGSNPRTRARESSHVGVDPSLTPIINIKKEKRETLEETEGLLQQLCRDDFVSDLSNDPCLLPVTLPLDQSGSRILSENVSTAIKPEPVWECEKHEGSGSPPRKRSTPILPQPQPVNVQSHTTLTSIYELFSRLGLQGEEKEMWQEPKKDEDAQNDMEEKFLFFQLPDSLPGQVLTPQDDVKVKTEVQIKTEQGGSVTTREDEAADGSQGSVCSLKTLPEGPLGRLQLHKSGRVQLVLGHVSLDVTMGTDCSFLQELVSVRLREGRGGELVMLGKVGTRLICSPDFPSLLRDAN
uniref:DNA-directed RNA polymerase III subunit RPC4 isoform X2 n=1 Tax=Myxine glutinosa TaxID=7769 RepID=UPI00358E100D